MDHMTEVEIVETFRASLMALLRAEPKTNAASVAGFITCAVVKKMAERGVYF